MQLFTGEYKQAEKLATELEKGERKQGGCVQSKQSAVLSAVCTMSSTVCKAGCN